MDLKINTQVFHRHITKLYDLWKNDANSHQLSTNGSSTGTTNGFSNVDAILLVCGQFEIVSYSKTLCLQEWLFGIDISDSVIVFCQEQIICYASKKKVNYLQPLATDSKIPIIFYTRQNANEDEYFSMIIEHIKTSKKGKIMGSFLKEKFDGTFFDKWNQCLKKNKLTEMVDLSSELSELMCVKEADELSHIQVASDISCNIFNKFFKTKLLDLIESNKKIKHSDLAAQIEDCLDKNIYYSTNSSSSVKEEDVEMAFPVIIQSGGNYSIKFNTESDNNNLKFDVIVLMLGVRYKYYCSCLVRTLMINPSDEQQKYYKLLQESFDLVMKILTPGKQLKEVYEAFYGFFDTNDKSLLQYLPTNIGFSTGIQFKDPMLLLDATNTKVIRPNMSFNVLITLNNVQIGPSKYSFSIGDTIQVTDNDDVEHSVAFICTTLTKRQLGSVTVRVDESSDDASDASEKITISSQSESDDESSNGAVSLIRESRVGPVVGGGRKRNLPKREATEGTELKRKTHQKELAGKLHKTTMKRYLNVTSSSKSLATDSHPNSSASNKFKCYTNVKEIPREKEITEMRIHVDKMHDCIVLPIMGMAIPFHISTIKNINTSLESDYMYLRINFVMPMPINDWTNENGQFKSVAYGSIKEIIYRSLNIKEIGKAYPDSSHLVNVFRLVKELQKKFKTQQAEQKELEGLVRQDDLQLSTHKSLPRLKNLLMRPTIGNRRAIGLLEVHRNGFRYTSTKTDHIDVLFSNIKHAFYQPCDNEMVTLIHFKLKDPLLHGKKKLHDVQFYTETGVAVSDLDKPTFLSNRNDPDEIEAEERELENIQRINNVFKHFCEAVETLTDGKIEFDSPFKDLGFDGVPSRLSISLTPTTHCLINLMEMPFFVLSLNEIELVHFERIQANTKHFDMVFVYKDYSKKVTMIGCVPMSSLEAVKDWLDSCDIKYSEGIQSLNWVRIMKTINDDPKDFVETGGWTFLDPESDQEGDTPNEDSDVEETYNPDSSDYDNDADDDSISDDYDDDDESEESADDEPSDAYTWDELEDIARNEDENKHRHHTGAGAAATTNITSNAKRRSHHNNSSSQNRKKTKY